MEIEIIKRMISNSTWIDPKKNNIYRFSENDQLSINGMNNQQYSVTKSKNQIIIKLGMAKMFVVSYVCDFILKINTKEEEFIITPA